jgi:hypothetical protein
MNATTFLNSFYNNNTQTVRGLSATRNVDPYDDQQPSLAPPSVIPSAVKRMFNQDELKQMEPSAEQRLKEMQMRVAEAE